MTEEKLKEVDLGTNPQKPRPHFDKFKTIEGEKIRANTIVETVQGCFCMGLQQDAWARSRIGSAHAQHRSRG